MTKISIEDIILGKDSVLCEITDVTSAYAVLGKPDVHEVGEFHIWLDYGPLSMSFDLITQKSSSFNIQFHAEYIPEPEPDAERAKKTISDYEIFQRMSATDIEEYLLMKDMQVLKQKYVTGLILMRFSSSPTIEIYISMYSKGNIFYSMVGEHGKRNHDERSNDERVGT